jgi:hypothetical protein
MAKKLKFSIDYFEDYAMLSIASLLKDYRIAYFINDQLGLELEKYDDFRITSGGNAYSWFCYSEGENGATFYLVGNHHPGGKLLPAQKGIDYFLLTKDLFDEERLSEMAAVLRKIPGVQGVFHVKMNAIRSLDLIIENLELHELEKVIKPRKEGSGPRLK